MKINLLKIQNHEFDGKKWEAMGCESGNNLILCGLSKKFKQKWENENMFQKQKLWLSM